MWLEFRHAVSLMHVRPEYTSQTGGHCRPLVACPQSCRPSPRAESAAWWKRGAGGPFLLGSGPGVGVQLAPDPRLPLLRALHRTLGSPGIWRAEAHCCLGAAHTNRPFPSGTVFLAPLIRLQLRSRCRFQNLRLKLAQTFRLFFQDCRRA